MSQGRSVSESADVVLGSRCPFGDGPETDEDLPGQVGEAAMGCGHDEFPPSPGERDRLKGCGELGSGLKHVELKEKSRTTVEPPTLKTPIQSRSAPSLLPLEVRRVMRAIVRPPWQPNVFWGVLDIESTPAADFGVRYMNIEPSMLRSHVLSSCVYLVLGHLDRLQTYHFVQPRLIFGSGFRARGSRGGLC